jgi:hypothetical protein
VLCFPLFDRENPSAKASKLGKFLLNRLQPLLSLAVSDLGLCFVSAFTTILVVQLLKLCDLNAEKSNLFPKDFEVIHNSRIASGQRVSVGRGRS